MTHEQLSELEARVTRHRDSWEPQLEDSIGVSIGDYRPHDEHCVVCKPIIAAIKEIATLRAELAARDERIAAYQEAEASVCPEDVGFVEFIGVLQKRIAALEEDKSLVVNAAQYLSFYGEDMDGIASNIIAAGKHISELEKEAEEISQALPDDAPHKHEITGYSLVDDIRDLVRDKQKEFERAEKHWQSATRLLTQVAEQNAKIATLQRELDAARAQDRIFIEVDIADRKDMHICGVWGFVKPRDVEAIECDLFVNGDEEPFLGEPESVLGVRLEVAWVRDGHDGGYWDFTTIARYTNEDGNDGVWTPSDAARGKAGV